MSLDQKAIMDQIDTYRNIMREDPNSREFLKLAELYGTLGVVKEAEAILLEGLTKHPDFLEARLTLAKMYLTQGREARAIQEFTEVLRLDPRHFIAHKLLGEIAMQRREHKKAAVYFRTAHEIRPDDLECKVMVDYINSLLKL